MARSPQFLRLRLFFLPLTILFAVMLFTTPTISVIGDATWITAVRKGTHLYQQMQSGCYPEKSNPASIADLLAGGWEFIPPWPPTKGVLTIFPPFVASYFGWTHGKDFFYEEVYHGILSLLLSFQQLISLSQLIYYGPASFNHRSILFSPERLHWRLQHRQSTSRSYSLVGLHVRAVAGHYRHRW